MKSFFYSTLIALGLAFSGISAHAQTASGDVDLDSNSEFTVTMMESGNTFTVSVSPDNPTARSSYADYLQIELFSSFGGAAGGGTAANFTSASGAVTAPWLVDLSQSNLLGYYSGDPSGVNALGNDIGQNQSFTGSFTIAPNQTVNSFQVTIGNVGLEESAGVFANFTPDGASMALIVPGLLPLGVALRRRRSSKAQA